MDFKSLISQLDQLNEATDRSEPGKVKHTAEPGGYGRKDDEDEDGNKIKDTSAEKKGKGRPKKATSTSGEDKKYDFSAFGVNKGKDVKLPAHDKKKTKKHSIKEYLDQIYAPLNEMGITVKPMPGASQIIGANGKPMGTADAATANTIKQASEKGTLKLGGEEGMKEGTVSDHPENQAKIQKQFSSIPGLMDVWKKYKHLGDYGTNLQTTMSAVKKEFPRIDPKTLQSISISLINDNDPYSSNSMDAAFYAAKEIQKYLGGSRQVNEKDIGKHNNATTGFDALVRKLTPKYGEAAAKRIAGSQLKKIREADMPPRDALASPLTMESRSKTDDKSDKKKCPPMSHIKKMCQDGKSVAEICKMHPDCDQKELKQMVADCKKKMVKEGMEHKLKAAYHNGKAHGLTGGSHCGKNYEDMEEARQYHEGYKCGLDECYGQTPIQGYVGEADNEVADMASYGAHTPTMEDDMYEMDKTSYMKQQAIKTPGDTFKAFGQTFKDKEVLESPFAFEALEKQLNALLEDKEVTEGMTVSISKGQQGSPDSVSVSAQDGEADQLLSVIKSAGLGLFGGDDSSGMSHTEPMTVDNGGEPAEIGAGGDAIEVVGDHDGMMNLMKKLSGISGGNSDYADEEGHDDNHSACESCGGMMEAGHSCSKDKEIVDEVQSVAQMTYQMAEDNPPDSGADNTNAEIADTTQANQAAAAYNPSQDIDEGGDGGEASDVGNVGVEAGDADEEMQADMNEAEDETGEEAGKEEEKKEMSESSFFNLYKKLAMLSEESTSEKDDKAEKAAKKVAKDIEYDEDHKGKDDDKAEKAGKEVKKDIEYDDKKDKKKIDEWANDAGKNGTDTSFETDIDFMMNVISGGLNKRKSTGQTTIPVVASQLGRQMSRNTTSINESVDSSDAVAQWKKLAGIK